MEIYIYFDMVDVRMKEIATAWIPLCPNGPLANSLLLACSENGTFLWMNGHQGHPARDINWLLGDSWDQVKVCKTSNQDFIFFPQQRIRIQQKFHLKSYHRYPVVLFCLCIEKGHFYISLLFTRNTNFYTDLTFLSMNRDSNVSPPVLVSWTSKETLLLKRISFIKFEDFTQTFSKFWEAG